MKFRGTLLLLAMSFTTSVTFADEMWIDVTDQYVKNARYDNNNADYWMGTPLGFVNPMQNAEHYQKSYDTYQDLSGLPAGRYRVSLQGYYRAGDHTADYNHFNYDGDAYRYAELYGSSSRATFSSKLVYASSGAVATSLGGGVVQVGDTWSGGVKYIPNNMEAAHYWFEAGYYDNSVVVTVESDGQLRIGIRKSNTLSGDWTCIDTWRLEYWGEVTPIDRITFGETSLTLVVGEQYRLVPTIMPENATNRQLKWQVGNTKILSVDDDGRITALAKGTTTVRATAQDGSGCYAMCNVSVTTNAATEDNIVINEIQSANADMFVDPSWNYGPWIELYNPTDVGVQLDGLYITDDANDLKKYRLTFRHGAVPANGYKVLWFDHYDQYAPTQIDFKLDGEGGEIILSDGNKVLAQMTYPAIAARVSYARTTDGGKTWAMTAMPTPGETNEGAVFTSKRLAKPVVDKLGQLFTGTLTAKVTIPDGTTLKYTTDGTTPTMENGMISENGVFNVTSSTVYRFRLFRENYLPSDVLTCSYIRKDRDYVFPIVSVVTKPENIYSTEMGIFMQGPNGRPGNGQTSKCNWNMEWERPVSMEYIVQGEDGNYDDMAFSDEVDMEMCGGWSRAFTPHSFKLKSNKQYSGNKFMNYQFFKDKPFLRNKTLQLRNGGNDTGCRIKDAALQEIVRRSGLYVDGQSWQPAHVFINGTYYDVLNIREPNNKHFAYANYGIDTDYMDQFEMSPDSGYVQMEGNDKAFLEWYELSKTASATSSYNRICQLVEIDEFANYMAVELYYGNWDWPQNNVKGFRDQNNGKFHFVLFDLDGALNSGTSTFNTFAGKQNYTFDVLHGEGIEGLHRTAEIKMVTIFLNMLKNPTFLRKFIDAYCIVGGSVATPKRVKEIVTEMSDYLGKNNFVRPSSTANSIINTLTAAYNNQMTNAMKSYEAFKLSSVNKRKLNLTNNNSKGKLYLNDNVIPTGEFDGYIFPPVTLKAEAPAGMKFLGWVANTTSKTTKIFAQDATWKYYDKGSLDGKDWKSASYGDNTWSSGNAPLGYAKDGLKTTIGYGGNSNDKYPTYYFRKTFTLENDPTNATFKFNFIIDDGFILYINGVEVGRYNMPLGNVTFKTYATSYAPNNPDTGELTVEGKYFKQGTNVIAVEVHNNSATSTDIEWTSSLEMEDIDISGGEYVSTDKEYTLPSGSDSDLTAVFGPVSEEETRKAGTKPIMINEISADNEIFVSEYFKKGDWIELYNTTSEDIDVVGMYVSDNESKPTKYQITKNENVNTIVPAHGHLIVWCDKLEPMTYVHASYKLDAEGGCVILTSADKSWSDKVTYPKHDGWHSVGRYPDGSKEVYVFSCPTIYRANMLSLGDEKVVQKVLGDVNGDGNVDVADITALASYILGEPSADFVLANADVNEDGSIDVADITAVATIILENAKKEMLTNFE